MDQLRCASGGAAVGIVHNIAGTLAVLVAGKVFLFIDPSRSQE
jgi:hypothetical protein